MTKIPYEIPTEIRDMTAKSIEEARKASERFSEAAHKASAQAEGAANMMQSSVTRLVREWHGVCATPLCCGTP
jgi:hypothetical protein